MQNELTNGNNTVCEIRVMSFNIRGSFHTGDGANVWENRAALNVRTIKRYVPDLIGFQELQRGNLEIYEKELPEYKYILGPVVDEVEPSYNPIFWNPSRFELIDSGGFWLSLTPDQCSSAWEAACIRAANWVRLRCTDTGSDFLHLNTHLDHISELARVEGSKLLLQQFDQLPVHNLPLVVTGDFNCNPGSTTYRFFMEHGFVDTYLAAGNEDSEDSNTFHGFAGEQFSPVDHHMVVRIDWILTRDGVQSLQTVSCVIVRDAEPPLYPSDHYPVLAELKMKDER